MVETNMVETNILEKEAIKKAESWKNFSDYPSIQKPEISYQLGWFNLPKSGGGDIDLADYKNGR